MAAREHKEHERSMKTINEVCDLVRETAYAIHVCHGHGHLEKVFAGHRPFPRPTPPGASHRAT